MAQRAPKKLGKKLRVIREYKNWTLDQMAAAVGREDAGRRTRVYEWEQGIRQPDLTSLLEYARLAGVSTDVLLDDKTVLKLHNKEV
jgi:transcriptional regulator with XRE-family HTH domain